MNRNFRRASFILVLGVLVGLGSGALYLRAQPYEVRRLNAIAGLNTLIAERVEAGEYDCCVDPPCDMCFLGHWIWGDGVCRCDEMMEEGEFGKVCPQCLKGAEEGRCKSANGDVCPAPT